MSQAFYEAYILILALEILQLYDQKKNGGRK